MPLVCAMSGHKVTAGETIPMGPRRRSNRPGNSQAKGPQPRTDAGECWADRPAAEGASDVLRNQDYRENSQVQDSWGAHRRRSPSGVREPVGASA